MCFTDILLFQKEEDATQGRRDRSPAPVLWKRLVSFSAHFISLLLQANTGTALGTAAGQDLPSVAGGHTLPKTVNLGAVTLFGLIGTNHGDTSYCMGNPGKARPQRRKQHFLRGFPFPFVSRHEDAYSIIDHEGKACQPPFFIILFSFS